MQQHHRVEATAVTPDYPSVSDFDRDFLGLSSRSQWSLMLHRVVPSIQVRKQISGRRISHPHLSPLRTLVRLRRSLVPATRGLRRWDQPFESSSIIELDTEPRTEASAALSSSFSFFSSSSPLVSLTAVVFRAPPSTTSVRCLSAHPRHETLVSETPSKPHTCAHPSPVRTLFFFLLLSPLLRPLMLADFLSDISMMKF